MRPTYINAVRAFMSMRPGEVISYHQVAEQLDIHPAKARKTLSNLVYLGEVKGPGSGFGARVGGGHYMWPAADPDAPAASVAPCTAPPSPHQANVVSPHKSLSSTVRTYLVTRRGQWFTPEQIANGTGIHVKRVRVRLAQFRSEGFLHIRNGPKPPNVRGQFPREYTWSGPMPQADRLTLRVTASVGRDLPRGQIALPPYRPEFRPLDGAAYVARLNALRRDRL